MKDFTKISENVLHAYNGADTASTLLLYRWQKERWGPFGTTYRNLVGPAFWALGHVERWGALLSEKNVRAYDALLETRIGEAKARLHACDGVPADFNPRSPDQRCALLFKHYGLKPIGLTKTRQPSTDDDNLAELQFQHPKIEAIPALRDLVAAATAKSNYGINYLRHIGFDGRVHPSYRIVRSGRLATRQPTIQNLKSPNDDDEVEDDGKLARGCYAAPDGYKFVSIDYRQNELRMAAELSGDEQLAADLDSSDFHTGRARDVFSLKADEKPSKLQRRSGKTINFGIAFDQGPAGLAAALTILQVEDARERGKAAPPPVSKDIAQRYIDSLLKKYPKFAAWRRQQVHAGETSGDSWARHGLWAFRRQQWDVGETGKGRGVEAKIGKARRVFINNPIQCMANALMLVALHRCVARILDEDLPAQLVMSIHDACCFYVREDVWQEVTAKMKEEILRQKLQYVKLLVDIEVGDDFGHLEKVEI